MSPVNGGEKRWFRSAAGWIAKLTRMPSLSLILLLGLQFLVFGQKSEHFLEPRSIVSVLNQVPDLILVSIGMTFVLVVGEIDLSVGSIAAFSAAVTGVLLGVKWGWSEPVAIVAGLLAGLILGMTNGLLIVCLRVPSFLITLGMMQVARGLTQNLTDSKSEYLGAKLEWLRTQFSLGDYRVSATFLGAILMVVIGQVFLRRTVLGRHLLAVGGNEQAVRYSGVSTKFPKVFVFGLSGFLAAAAGIVSSSRNYVVDPNLGTGTELSAIAAVVLGGTSLSGGSGNVLYTLLGVLNISFLQTGLAQIGTSDPTKLVVTGTVIAAAAALDSFRRRRVSAGG